MMMKNDDPKWPTLSHGCFSYIGPWVAIVACLDQHAKNNLARPVRLMSSLDFGAQVKYGLGFGCGLGTGTHIVVGIPIT